MRAKLSRPELGVSSLQQKISSDIDNLKRLFGYLSEQRRKQFITVIGLTFLGAVAELLTLGAILPFLALLTNPSKLESYPILESLFIRTGWTNPSELLVPAT